MNKVFDKIILLIKSRKRYKCTHCKDTGFVFTKLSPEDNKSVNTLGKDLSFTFKHKCEYCQPGLKE